MCVILADCVERRTMRIPLRVWRGRRAAPAIRPADLYLNWVRSSRRLEMESHRNIAVIWLFRSLAGAPPNPPNLQRDCKPEAP